MYLPRALLASLAAIQPSRRSGLPGTGLSVDSPAKRQSPALDYSIPPGWTVPNVTLSPEELRGKAQQAINILKYEYWKDGIAFGWTEGTTLCAIVYSDYVSSNWDNYAFVRTSLERAKAHNSNFDPWGYNDDALWWGTAAFYAYRVYGGQEFLGWATDAWNWAARSQITPDQAAAGKSPMRNNTIRGQCMGHSVAGGVFWKSPIVDPNDMAANVISTSLFLTLSAYLAEATRDTKYIEAAKLAYGFVTAVLFDTDLQIPLDTVMLSDCSQNHWIFTYNSGKFAEGSVILSRVTGDNTYHDQAMRTVVNAIKKVPNWNDLNTGHITEGQMGTPSHGNDERQFKSIYVRALTEVFRREPANMELRSLIKAYININYNSMITHDTDGNGNYGLRWRGPFDGKYLSSQINAIDLLNAGIEVNWVR